MVSSGPEAQATAGPSYIYFAILSLLANANSRSLYVIVRPYDCLSSVCNVRAPYSGD